MAEPDDTFIGTVNEDWAVESMAGDIFLLGSHSWRIKQVSAGTVRVIDAGDAPPTVPFWLGEAPARTAELSQQVSELRTYIYGLLPQGPDADPLKETALARATEKFAHSHGTTAEIAEQAVIYIAAATASLGVVPTQQNIVFERFFDDTGGQQLVVHCPYGGRINRAFGLALRKRLCRRFDFELQAAANDNAIILSLGPHHSFPLSDVPAFLHPDSVQEVLEQAVLDSPMFTARWRWNLNRALVVLRSRGGRRNPASHPAHGGRRHHGRRVPRGRRLPRKRRRPHRDPRPPVGPTNPPRHPSTRPSTSTASASSSPTSVPARSAPTSATPPSPPPCATRSSTPAPTPSWTTPKSSTAAPTPSPCPEASAPATTANPPRSTNPPSARSPPTP